MPVGLCVSLTHLRRVSVDNVKIDRSSVAELSSSHGDTLAMCALRSCIHSAVRDRRQRRARV
jgi:EAL domain-containing protein (putative c-di-GMP-specific phosphodiesterase class I)